MIVVMERIGSIAERRRHSPLLRYSRPPAAKHEKEPVFADAFSRLKASFIKDQRGAVAIETLIVYFFLVTCLLLPLADVAAAGFQFISGWAALRSFGQYVQYNTPPDPTNPSTWISSLTTTTVAGYTISNIKIMCGDTNTVCSSSNVTSFPKYYSYTTTVTLAPIFLRTVLCSTSCTYTLPYSERFQ
jgi:hypothetical protein